MFFFSFLKVKKNNNCYIDKTNEPFSEKRENYLLFQKGFTFIETLIYIALFSIIIGGAIVGVYQIIESSDKLMIKRIVEQEGNFLLRKIDWVLTGAETIYLPVEGIPSSTLRVDKYNFGVNNPVEIGLDAEGRIWLTRAAEELGNDDYLTSDYITAANLVFEHNDPDGAGGKPAEIKVEFTLSAKSANQTFTQAFKTTKYLRK